MTIEGRRILVVGASSGIGRAFGVAAARAGGEVALTARRVDRLEDALHVAGSGVAFRCDVGDDASCQAAVDSAVHALGALDLVLYAAGSAPLQPLVDTDPEAWHQAFDINVVGVQRIVRAAVPHLTDDGIVAVLSSETVDRPRPGLGAYGASKAALDQSMHVWQVEHPTLRFTRVTVGATQPTEFGSEFDMSVLDPILRTWFDHGLMQEQYMETDEVAGFLVTMLGAALGNRSINVDHLTLRSPTPIARAPD